MKKDIIRCYDNGGKTFDRYTIVFMDREYGRNTPELREALAASDRPFHPLGFGQHTSAMPGRHLGKRIAFDALPKDVQTFVNQNL